MRKNAFSLVEALIAAAIVAIGLTPAKIREILPETCTENSTPAAGTFSLTFGTPTEVQYTASDSTTFDAVRTTSTMVYPVTAPDGSVLSYRSNTVTIVQPETVWPVP